MPIPSIIGDDEQVARYLFSDKVSWRDFMPSIGKNLSVTRHYGLSEADLWDIGLSVANTRGKTLRAKADFAVIQCRIFGGDVVADPIIGVNEYHAEVTGWTGSKDERMALAKHLCANSMVHEYPQSPDPE